MRTPKNAQNLVVSTGVAIGIFVVGLGFRSGTTGRDAQRIPAVIESMNPGPGDEVLRQSQVVVNLAAGYDASLVIDGIEIPVTRLDELSAGAGQRPGAQVNIPATAIFDPGTATISFLPQEGAVITGFTQGNHSARVTYWKATDGTSKAKTFAWEFAAN